MTDDVPPEAKRFAECIGASPPAVDVEPHAHGAHLWLVGGGAGMGYFPDEVPVDGDTTDLGLSNANALFDFMLSEVFTMDTIPDEHRHYREGAAIFLNLCLRDLMREREDDAPLYEREKEYVVMWPKPDNRESARYIVVADTADEAAEKAVRRHYAPDGDVPAGVEVAVARLVEPRHDVYLGED